MFIHSVDSALNGPPSTSTLDQRELTALDNWRRHWRTSCSLYRRQSRRRAPRGQSHLVLADFLMVISVCLSRADVDPTPCVSTAHQADTSTSALRAYCAYCVLQL